jgi:hypothetical protein
MKARINFQLIEFIFFSLKLSFGSYGMKGNYINQSFRERRDKDAFPFLSVILTVQGVPMATEPGISLIILTPVKILQRNLNRFRFVV